MIYFKEALIHEREMAGLTRAQAAKILEMSYRTLQEWELGNAEPPEYAQKAILYCLDAIRCDRLAGELRAELMNGMPENELIQVQCDNFGRIFEWDFSERKVAERRRYASKEELEEYEDLPPEETRHMTIGDAYKELMLRTPYLTNEEAEMLYPKD